ncbi:MAG: hypothetical protein NTV39_04475 [Candidatus Saccharibacteria bacterium]|nr:hypothetical protein [Candidatus Saccharibacteria bacterium]
MPFVQAFIACDAGTWRKPVFKGPKDLEDRLLIANNEIVPAALNSPMGPLTPESIEFVPIYVLRRGLNVDVVIKIEAGFYEDRNANIAKRSKSIEASLRMLLPDTSFAVMTELKEFVWNSQTPDPSFDGDMSMQAAFQRAANQLLAPFMR